MKSHNNTNTIGLVGNDKLTHYEELVIRESPYGLEDVPIEHQTERMCIYAVTVWPNAIRFVAHQTEAIIIAYMNRFGAANAMSVCKNKTQRIKELAFEKDPFMLKYLEQTEELCLEAVQRNGMSLEVVLNQTPAICKAAVQSCPKAIQFAQEQTPDICQLAVKLDSRSIEYIRAPTEELCVSSVKASKWNISDIRNITDDVCYALLEHDIDGSDFYRIPEYARTQDVCETWARARGVGLRYVKNQTEELCIAAIQANYIALMDVRVQTEAICRAAMQISVGALSMVDKSFLHLFV